MDGGHRIAKAWILGHTTIAAVRFLTTPDPDYVVPDEQPAGEAVTSPPGEG